MYSFYKILNLFSDKSLDYKKCKYCNSILFKSFLINNIYYKEKINDEFINLYYYNHNVGDVSILTNFKTNKIISGPNLFDIKLSIHCTGINSGCGYIEVSGKTKNNHIKLNDIYSYKYNYRNACIKSIKHKELSIIIIDNSRVETFNFFVKFEKRKSFIDNLIFL